jgi:protein arginine kinase
MDEKILKCDRWLDRSGPQEGVVMSTRARYARNLPAVPFPRRAREADLRSVFERVSRAVDHNSEFAGGYRFAMSSLAEEERQYLREARLISAEMEKTPRHRGLFVSADMRQGVMVNEEDHLRLYALEAGFRPYEALQQVIELETALARDLPFAFSPKFGYLTACTTNTGTGLRVSALVHLPGLSLLQQMRGIVGWLRREGMTARGFYGENTENHGGFFQVSNEVTLGRDERQIVDTFSQVIEHIIDQESEARQRLARQSPVEDRIWRACGILSHARLVSTNEAMELLALVRLGIDMHVIHHIPHAELNKLVVAIQPAHVRAGVAILARESGYQGQAESEEEVRDRARAQILRQRFRGAV